MMKGLLSLVLTFSIGQSFALENSKPVETYKYVDLTQYLGTWYEIASIPIHPQKDCIGNVTADYSIADEKDLIKVVNACETNDGSVKTAEGRARVEDITTNAKLKVTFLKLIDWVFVLGGDYWVLDIGPGYSYSVVGDGDRDTAWILSRTPVMPEEELRLAYNVLVRNNYDTCKVLTTVQNGGFTERKPLCEIFEK